MDLARAKKIIGVTGHRASKLGGHQVPNPIYHAVRRQIDEAFIELLPDLVLTGMALGVDQWVAEICVQFDIPFAAIIPFEGQESVWPSHAQARYHWLLSKAAWKYVVSPGEYHVSKLQTRNEWIVSHCNLLLAVYNGTKGGTANCIAHALRVRCPIRYITPPTYYDPGPAPGSVLEYVQGVAQHHVQDRDRIGQNRAPPKMEAEVAKVREEEQERNRKPRYTRAVDLG
jgi:uncharacterized phage-like protein YoqJ